MHEIQQLKNDLGRKFEKRRVEVKFQKFFIYIQQEAGSQGNIW